MSNAAVLVAVVAMAAIGVFGFRYYMKISKDPQAYTSIDPDADNAWGTILGGDFAGQTPDRASALAVQKAFAIAITVPVLIIVVLAKVYYH